VDVDDAALAHIRAIEVPEAEGKRFLICEHVISLSEFSKICHDALTKEYDGVKFNLKDMPYAVAWLASLVNPFAALALARWKRKDTYS
jgi:nucleoside-diphosphate-sugar epimerase